MTTPMHLAFYDQSSFYYNADDTKSPIFWEYFNNLVDFLFFSDIIITFNTSIYDEDFVLIQNRGVIAKKYLSGWFVIDSFAILPFDAVMG